MPMKVVHRNEASAPELAVAATVGLPVVLATHSDGRHSVLLDRDSLTVLDGSVSCFESALLAALEGSS